MKGRIAMLRRSGLSILLVVCLMVGMCVPAFAVKSEKHAKLDEAVAELIDLIVEYKGDLYEYAYDWAEGEGYIDDAVAYIDEVLALLEDEAAVVEEQLEELKVQLEDAKAQVADAEVQLADAKAELEGYKQDLADAKAELEQAKQDLEDAKAELEGGNLDASDDIAQAEADIADAEAEIAQAEADIADAEVQLADAEAQLADAKAQVAEADQQLADAEDALDALIADLKESLAAAKALIVEADTLDQTTLDALAALFDELEQDAAKMEELMGIIEDVEVEVPELEQLGNLYAAYVILTEDLIPLVEEDLIPAIQAAQEYAQEKIDYMMKKLGITYDNAAEKIPELVYDATHGKYEITEESHYVALGGATAAGLGFRDGKTYSELFAEHLGLADSYKDLTDDELDVAGAVQYIKDNAAEIKKADIITYQMDAYMFVMTALDGTVDWSKYVSDAEIVADIADAKAALVEELSLEYDAQTVADAADQVERVLYALVAYGFENANAVKEIKAINSDAVLVVLGMYNPLQGLTIDVDGTVIDVSELCENLMIATDVNNLIFAMTSGGVVFVEISQAEAEGYDPIVVDTEDLKAAKNELLDILDNLDNMCANADGHEYIYNQILDALEITKKVPETGDNSNLGMWITISVLCAAAFVGMIGYNKVKGCAK